ncbi:MAG: hypothetical protein JJ975_03795 [Bacteroidia bacterium]|nr:hypothetical protein [Bacteroidia bacterium]
MNSGKYRGKAKMLMMIPIFILAILAMTTVVMLLWNELMPELFNLKEISFWQSMGLIALSKLLFPGSGSFGKHKGYKKHGYMKEKMMHMSPEEREEFKARWRQRCSTHYRNEAQPSNDDDVSQLNE